MTHAPHCKFRVSVESAVGIECEHGFDSCPTCDPCTCIPIGTCSKFPRVLCGLRVKVVGWQMPRFGEEGMLYEIQGTFAKPHDGVPELECVHVDHESFVAVRFADDTVTSGYHVHAIEVLA